MEAAEDLSVLLGGLAPLGIRGDVIDLATLCRGLTKRVGAALVADLNGPAGRPGEEPGLLRAFDPFPGPKMMRSKSASLNQGTKAPGLTTGPPSIWLIRPLRVS